MHNPSNDADAREIVLTPAYDHIFRTMLREALNQSDALSLFDCLPFDLQAQALRAVQRFLAPLNIAAQCMTTKEAVEEFREAFSRIVVDIDKTAAGKEDLD
jgi:hypothetical protein